MSIERYRTDPAFRAKVRQAQNEAARKRRRDPATMTQHMRNQIARETLSPSALAEFKRERMLILSRRGKQVAKARGYKRKSCANPMLSIRREIADIRRRLDAIDLRLRPRTMYAWMLRGYWTRRQWSAAEPNNHRQWLLADWKAKTYSRMALVYVAGGDWTSGEWWERMKHFGYRCAYCGMHRRQQRASYGTDMEADHVIALTDGGTNHLHNVAPACKGCNSSKSDGDLLEWARRRGLTIHPLARDAYDLGRSLMECTHAG